MITKGYLLIHSDGTPYEPYETILGFSENKEELEQKASDFNTKREDSLNRFNNCFDQISLYEENFEDFRKVNDYAPTREKFKEWLKQNPIPSEIEEFVSFYESDEEVPGAGDRPYEFHMKCTLEHELMDSYYVSSFSKHE